MKIYTARISDYTETEFAQMFDMMSDERKKAVLRMKFENDRKRSILGENLARNGINEQFNIPIEEIRFGRTEQGKPFAIGLDIEFSISHSKDAVVCAVDSGEIGIDIEFMREMDMRITKIACTESDREYIFAAENEEEQNFRFFKIWTAKEAYLKYIGTGIINLKTVSYEDIEPFCETYTENGYMITVYRK